MRLEDFEGYPEAARREIYDWVSDETNQRIRDLIPEGEITSSTQLVLANAIYFKATWEHEFDPDKTSDRDFTLLTGDEISVEMMLVDSLEIFSFAEGEDW